MAKVDDLQRDVQVILDLMRAYVERASDLAWTTSDGLLPILLRAILRRQYESLQAISRLVTEEMGFAAGPLLRPACEEFIWTKYLLGIPEDAAEELLACVAADERLKSLRAQDNTAGRSVTQTLGLLGYLQDAERSKGVTRGRLSMVATRLQWPKDAIKKGQLPSIAWLAKKTKQYDTYTLVYHGTSRFVHFSVHELLRRAWTGLKAGRVTIGSDYFRNYWAHFSLHWGLILFVRTLAELVETLDVPVEVDDTILMEVAKRIGKTGKIPIITAAELYWPERG